MIVAQGTEAGGYAGLINTVVSTPLVVRAEPQLPMLAAGGIATSYGLTAAMAREAEGGALGTWFLATAEVSIPEGQKRSMVASEGHNTLLTELPDLLGGFPWRGAYARVARNGFIEGWAGCDGGLQYRRVEVR